MKIAGRFYFPGTKKQTIKQNEYRFQFEETKYKKKDKREYLFIYGYF